MPPWEDTTDWRTPGAWEIAPGVHRIPLPMPNDGLHAVNVYAVRDGDDLTLIDSGWAVPTARAELATALRSIEAELADIKHFAITHAHRDHYTLAVELRAEYGMTISLGKKERATMESILAGWGRSIEAQFDRLSSAGAETLVEELRVLMLDPPGYAQAGEHYELPDRWLGDDDKVVVGDRILQVVSTPGHTDGHVVFADAQAGLLFTGDHLLPRITPSIGFEPVVPDMPLKNFLSSLETVLQLPDLRLLPAHGHVTASSHERAGELIRHHEDRLEELHRGVAGSARTAAAAAAAVPWTRRNRHFKDLGPFNRMLAVLETVAHLDVLVDRGLLGTDVLNGTPVYVPAVSRLGRGANSFRGQGPTASRADGGRRRVG